MYARVQALAMGKRVYLVGFGSPRQEDLQTQEAADFFNAFTIESMPEQAWEVQLFKDYYFSISLPATPKMVKLPVTDSSVASVQFSTMDNSRGSYFGVTVVTTNAGYIVPDDSAYFSSAVERLQNNMVIDRLEETDTVFSGFNARHIKASMNDGLRLNCIMINRGNRVYNLMAITNREDSAHANIRAFFDSFSFSEYPQLQWQQKPVNEYAFNVPVTGQFSKVNYLDEDADSTASLREYQWLTYDSISATSFFITRRALSPYLWAKHDSVLLKKYMNDLTEEGETVTGYKFVRNGNSNGIEFNIQRRNTSLAQRIRVLVNGQAVYILQTDAPLQYWNKYNYQHFLEGFRFSKETKPDFLYTNSFQKLLTDLRSADSLTHEKAYEAIRFMIYDSTDIPALLQAATVEYVLDTSHYYTSTDKFLDALGELKHSGFMRLIEDHYHSLKPAQEQFRFGLLQLLASHNTDGSFTLIEKLLKEGLPSKGEPSGFVRNLRDSLLLTKKLYPYLFTLTGDTLLGPALFGLHRQMVDSNLISIDVLKTYEPLILKAARAELAKIALNKEEDYYSTGIYAMADVLGKLGSDSAYIMLRRVMNSSPVNIKYIAALELLKKKQPVDAATLLQVAADPVYRVDFYDELKDMKLEKAFPAKYFTQKAFAESYLYITMDEDEPSKIEAIGERTVKYLGTKQKFFLFKTTLEYDGKQTTYLGISGPFSTDGKEVVLEDYVAGIYWEEEFKQSLIDRHFKAFLAEREEAELAPPPIDEN